MAFLIEITLSSCNLAGDRIDPNSLFHELAVRWRNGNHRSNSLFRDLVVVRFDRFAARQITILFLDLHIALVHGLF